MSKSGRNMILVLAGLAVAVSAVVAMYAARSAAEQAEAVIATTAVPTTVAEPVTQVVAEPVEQLEPVVVHLETPPPKIEGLSESVARVLTARGFAETVGFEDPTGEIPASIVRVLAERGVTLSVAEGADAP